MPVPIRSFTQTMLVASSKPQASSVAIPFLMKEGGAHKKSIASGVANSSAERARISSMGIVG